MVQSFSRLQSGQGSGQDDCRALSQDSANETTAGKTTALQCCGDEREGFSVMAASACFCRKAILLQARSGSSLRRRTMAFSPFSVAVTSRVFVLNILRAIYNSCAIVVPPGRCGWFRNMPAPTSFLAAAEIRGCFSVMAVAGCSCRTAIVAQVSCGT